MGTVIDRLDVTRGGWRTRHSALHLAVSAAQTCLERAGRNADDLDLLVNVGLYRDRNLGEPALAALIQEDIGAHPEDPHDDTHGTFSSMSQTDPVGLSTVCRSSTDSCGRTRSTGRWWLPVMPIPDVG